MVIIYQEMCLNGHSETCVTHSSFYSYAVHSPKPYYQQQLQRTIPELLYYLYCLTSGHFPLSARLEMLELSLISRHGYRVGMAYQISNISEKPIYQLFCKYWISVSDTIGSDRPPLAAGVGIEDAGTCASLAEYMVGHSSTIHFEWPDRVLHAEGDLQLQNIHWDTITYLMRGRRVQARFFVHIWRREAESDMIQIIWLEPDDPWIK